jgi:hypothetical protein
MSVSREQVYQALFNLVTPLRATGAVDGFPDGKGPRGAKPGTPTADKPFNCVTREIIEAQRVPPALQPILMLYEFNELTTERGRGQSEREWQVILMIGVTSQAGTPGQTILNPCIEKVLAALEPSGGEELQTLGNLVDRVVLKGTAGKDHGNNSTAGHRQATYYLPVSIFPGGN